MTNRTKVGERAIVVCTAKRRRLRLRRRIRMSLILPPPIPCTECDGSGEVDVYPMGTFADPGDAHRITCDRCHGSRVESCWVCEAPATQIADDEYLCEAHAVDTEPAPGFGEEIREVLAVD